MGKVAAVKRGRGGRSRSKGKDSDDSDEDYMIEEDEDYIDDEEEDKLFSSEEDENDDDDDEETEQCYNDLSDHDIGFKEEIEDEVFCKTAQIKRKRSGLARMKLGTRISNIHRNELRNHNEPDDESESQTERLQVSEEDEAVNEVNILKRKRSCLDQMKVCSKVSRIRRNAHKEFDDEDYNVEEVEEEDDDEEEEQTPKLGVSEEEQEIDEVTCSNLNRSCLDQEKLHTNSSNSRRSRHGKVDDEDYNFDDEEEDEDEDDDEDDDFTLDESFSLEEDDDEEEEEHVVKKKNKNNKPIKRTSRKKSSGFRRRKKRTNAPSKVCKKKKESHSVRRNVGLYEEDDGDDCEDEDFTMIVVRKRRTKKKPRCRTRNFTVHSDSDFVDSGPSEIEFTISEEEREQVREASNICRKSTEPLRNSCSYKDSDSSFAQKRKLSVTKGKEKIPELKKDMVKQVCGICFSEEGKNTTRGALSSCSHYFCFACILEWSKVESRCPLCKQRFQAITKSVKGNTGVDSKDVVFPIPERDQVYQPTEEEIRGYLDPYENVICTECREGGADELMLLCDLCDSPAHTFCVGLGNEVPEGNWYCEGCRPASLGPSNNQIQDSITGQRNLFHRLSSFEGIRDDIDGSFSTPSTPFPQGFGNFLSPRYHGGSIQASSPRSGTGAVTVSGRRQIRRQMHLILSNNRSRQATETLIGDTVEVDVGQSHSSHRTSSPARPLEIGTSFSTQFNEESCHMPPTPQSMQFLPMSSHQLADQLVLDTTPILDEINVQGVARPRPSNISPSHNVQPFIFSNNTNVGCDYHMSSSTLGVGSNFYLEEQVKPLVRNYLESMSRTLTLGPIVREEIERKSQNTILAACGHLHHPSEVFPVALQPRCIHSENPLIPTSPLKDHCISCFNTFAKEVVKTVMNSKLPHFLHVRD